MEINRSNYEIWFTDWLDGNLNPQQELILRRFLIDNPDLNEEVIDLSSISIEPLKIQFNNKEQLKKSPSDISKAQFDILCVAYLENDLSAEQQNELAGIIKHDKKREIDFTDIQKIKLTPVVCGYKNKNKLLRRTVTQNLIRFSVIGISVAAAVTFIITTYLSINPNPFSTNIYTSQRIIPDTVLNILSAPFFSENKISDQNVLTNHQQIESRPSEILKESYIENTSYQNSETHTDPFDESIYYREAPINKIFIQSPAAINASITTDKLIANIPTLEIPPEEEERSKIARFLSKNFREKILKEDSPADSPLKGYEIAEAGVSGINRLLGWDMALNKKTDENGELRSVYFNSKMLKFSTTVKKSQP